MSEPREPSVQTNATVAHIGGGRSASVAAVAVAVVLGVIVWIGASNRPPAPSAPAPAAAATVLIEAADASTEPTPASTEPAPPSLAPSSPPAPRGLEDVFAISVSNQLGNYTSFLDELEPGHLSGEVHLPMFLIRPATTIVFQQLLAPWSPNEPVVIGQWDARTRRLGGIRDRVKLIVNAAVPADETAPGDLSRPARQGFWLRAGIQLEDGLGTVKIDVRVGPEQQMIGRTDGLFGPSGNAPDASEGPEVIRPAVDYPRDRGLYNRCRWDVAPYSGRPIPGTDEADC